MAPFDPDQLRVLIISRDPLARGGLCAVISALQGLELVGASAALDAGVDAGSAEVVVWDGAGSGGFPAVPSPPILALSPDLEGAREALYGGARGVLLRDGDGARLLAAIRAVDCGMTVVDEAFSAAIVSASGAPSVPGEPLTPREMDVLALLAEGLSNRGVARRLQVSEHTAKFHVNAILAKLGARSRTDAVVRGLRRGLFRV